MKAALIATGSELVEGRVLETNNNYIAKRLRQIGISIIMHCVVGDDKEHLKKSIMYCMQHADIIIISGGLGPTVDDITRKALQQLFDLQMEIHQPSKMKMEALFQNVGKKAIPSDYAMITVPLCANIFENHVGLAPGFSITVDNKEIIALPGVPKELHAMLENTIEYLQNKYHFSPYDSITFKVVLMREAEVDQIITSVVHKYSSIDVSITYDTGITTVVVTSIDGQTIPKEIISEIQSNFGNKLIYGFTSLEEKVVTLFREARKTLAIAESCTGGLIAKKITDIPGSSDVFLGGVVAYSNMAKINILGVNDSTLNACGAVSQEVALEMAIGAKKRFNANYAIATTGIAGPGGGTATKPVGLVCFAVVGNDTQYTTQMQFSGNRDSIRTMASLYALVKLLDCAGLG